MPVVYARGRSLQYEEDFGPDVQMLAQATREEGGVRFHHEFADRSSVAYDMIYAVTSSNRRKEFVSGRAH